MSVRLGFTGNATTASLCGSSAGGQGVEFGLDERLEVGLLLLRPPPAVSFARAMSCCSFIARPTPRAAVVARPSVAVLTALRPNSAPEDRGSNRQPRLELLLARLPGLPFHGLLGPPDLLVERGQFGRVLLAQFRQRQVALFARQRSAAGCGSPAPTLRDATRHRFARSAAGRVGRPARARSSATSPRPRRSGAWRPPAPTARRSQALRAPTRRSRGARSRSSPPAQSTVPRRGLDRRDAQARPRVVHAQLRLGEQHGSRCQSPCGT